MQVAMPRIAAHLIAGRLTDGGGTASVSVSALPAARLFFGDGDSFSVDGRGLALELTTEGGDGFDSLDGFDSIHVSVADSAAEPFRIGSFLLTRDGVAPYHLVARLSTTAHDLVALGAQQLGFVGGLALRFGAGQALGDSENTRIPVRMDMQLASQGGRIVVIAGSTTVAGIPTGPLAELITQTIAIKL
jgi:hypothetical protein